MRRRRARRPLLAALVLTAPLAAQQQLADASCRICHPGPTRGLQQSAHAALLARPLGDSCTVCHGDLSGHVAAATRPGTEEPVRVPAVGAAACAACHEGRELRPAAASHPVRDWLDRLGATEKQVADERTVAALEREERRGDAVWSGLVDFGYRFVHTAGSREGYETDVDLEPGARLRTLELRGDRAVGPSSQVMAQAHQIGDPRWDAGVELRGDAGALDLDYRRDRFRYEAAGDYHRVDRTTRTGIADLDLQLEPGLRAFASFVHREEDGFWLTQRIGNRNVSTQSFVDGVQSPRTADTDDTEAGLLGSGDVWTWSASASWREDRTRDQWFYSQPAPANPAFPESEDFTSRTSLRGPGGRLQLEGDLEPVRIEVTARYFDHDRRVVGDGTGAGFDIAQFTTETTALGAGSAQTWLVDLAATLDAAADLQFVVDLHWRDHTEDMSLSQTDVTTFPTLATMVTVTTDVDQHTAQRLFDGALTAEWAALDCLDLAIGYGFAREWLRVPVLIPTDPRDFTSGLSRDDGLLAHVRYRPAPGWTVRGDLRDFAQDGALLNEIEPERAREAAASVGYSGTQGSCTGFVRHRSNENDTTQHELDALSTGLSAGIDNGDTALSGTYVFARTDSQTLTNFYFDPDPNPVPTLVGFEGDTHSVSGSVVLSPSSDVRWEFTGSWTKTTGDFDVSLLDWRADLRWQVAGPRGAVGTEFWMGRYRDQTGANDWDAQAVFVYWRVSF